MDNNRLRELIRKIIQKETSIASAAGSYEAPINVDDEDEELEEVTVTSDADGYSTPKAFTNVSGKKRKKAGLDGGHNKPDVFGYSVVKEELEKKDLLVIKKLIRDIIGDVFRDIWVKRNAWK